MSAITNQKLKKLNRIMAGVHAAQGILILILAKSFSLPLTTGFLYFNEQTKSL